MVGYCAEWYGSVRYGMAWYGMVQYVHFWRRAHMSSLSGGARQAKGARREKGRSTGAAFAHPEASEGGWEPKLHRDNDSYDSQKYSKLIFGAELICGVSLAARTG